MGKLLTGQERLPVHAQETCEHVGVGGKYAAMPILPCMEKAAYGLQSD
jgi:hypothetical protein